MAEKKKEKLPFYPLSFRSWHGMTLGGWLRLLARGRFRVSPARLPMAVSISLFSLGNSVLRWQEKLLFGRRVAQQEIEHAPLFIIGHWRTGTTLLHELLVLDERFTFSSQLQVTSPHHFLSTSWATRWLFRWFLPKQRPMDNMAVGVDRPQEDEFAMATLGLPSPYLSWAWPNDTIECENYLELSGLSDAELSRWKEAFVGFLKRITVANPRQIVLKSPTHTARVKTFVELFPKAKFIHIVRNPLDVVPSTIRTWKRMQYIQGLQTPRFENLEDYLFDFHERMYRNLERDRQAVPESQFCDVRYEELIDEPIASLRRIYDHLDLAGFDAVRPRFEAYFEAAKDYRTNRHEVSDELHAKIAERWAAYIERYGYADAFAAT